MPKSPRNPVMQNKDTKRTVRTSVDIDIDTYERIQKFMIEEYKKTSKRVFLKDLISPALDLYIATLGGK